MTTRAQASAAVATVIAGGGPAWFGLEYVYKNAPSHFTFAPHIRVLNRHLVHVIAGRTKRLIVTMPPRHGKSTMCSELLPATYLGVYPDREVILGSYEADFASSWGRKVRDALTAYGSDVFGVALRKDSHAASRWQIDGRQGGMFCTGIGGPATGRGASLMIIDDPVKNVEQASSPKYRRRAWDWYRAVARSRLTPEGAVVLIMTRWHEDDLAGRLLAEAGDDWTIVDMPAVAMDQDDALGREVGSPLWPIKVWRDVEGEVRKARNYDAEWMETTEERVGEQIWNALYLQRPRPGEGALFKRAYLQQRFMLESNRWARLGAQRTIDLRTCIWFQVIDTAQKDGERNDYTVIMTCAYATTGELLIWDVWRARVEFPEAWEAFKAQRSRYPAAFQAIEDRNAGTSILQLARRAGIKVRELRPSGSKAQRAGLAAVWSKIGRIWFPEDAPWLPAFESEVTSFPVGVHDDQVDVFAYAALVAADLTTSTGKAGAGEAAESRYTSALSGVSLAAPSW